MIGGAASGARDVTRVLRPELLATQYLKPDIRL